jgi:hypothetical protein
MDTQMTTMESPDSVHEPTSRRGFAKAAIAALAIAGFGAAALNGVLTGQGGDAEAVSAERRRRRSGGRRRRSGGRRRRSGGQTSGRETSGSETSGRETSGSETSGSDD